MKYNLPSLVEEVDLIPPQMKHICVGIKVRDLILPQMEWIYVDVKVRDLILHDMKHICVL